MNNQIIYKTYAIDSNDNTYYGTGHVYQRLPWSSDFTEGKIYTNIDGVKNGLRFIIKETQHAIDNNSPYLSKLNIPFDEDNPITDFGILKCKVSVIRVINKISREITI